MDAALDVSLQLCTAALGVFLAVPLLAMARQRPANAWLAAFVGSLASLAMADFCMDTGLYRRHPQIIGMFDWPLACLGGAFYCYTRSITGLGVGRRQAWHLLPLPLWLGVLLALRNGAGSWLFASALLILQLLTLAYGIAVLWRLRQYHHALRQQYSSTRQRDLHWLSYLSAVLMTLLLVWLPATMLGGAWSEMLLAGRLGVLCFAGWFGMRHAGVFLGDPVPAPVPVAAAEEAKYARSGMTQAAGEEIGRRLAQRARLQRDFLEPELALAELAERLGTSPQLLSQFLNDCLGLTFYDYINGLRVAEVQRLMQRPEHAASGLLELSLAAGFNSRSTFNAAFKKVTGTAPSIWRKQQAGMSGPIGADDKHAA